jgi:hypothetical protein
MPALVVADAMASPSPGRAVLGAGGAMPLLRSGSADITL